jgi:HSP20 family protein
MALPIRGGDGEIDRSDPFAEVNRLTQQLSGYLGMQLPSLAEGFTPLADIEESEDAYTVELELPGVSIDDISVRVSEEHLVVSGERKEPERAGVLRRRTRSVGRFHYEATLPAALGADSVRISLADGVLRIRVPKAGSGPESATSDRPAAVDGAGPIDARLVDRLDRPFEAPPELGPLAAVVNGAGRADPAEFLDPARYAVGSR